MEECCCATLLHEKCPNQNAYSYNQPCVSPENVLKMAIAKKKPRLFNPDFTDLSHQQTSLQQCLLGRFLITKPLVNQFGNFATFNHALKNGVKFCPERRTFGEGDR
jgi:hypothetical protein